MIWSLQLWDLDLRNVANRDVSEKSKKEWKSMEILMRKELNRAHYM